MRVAETLFTPSNTPFPFNLDANQFPYETSDPSQNSQLQFQLIQIEWILCESFEATGRNE